jgi:acetyl esterase
MPLDENARQFLEQIAAEPVPEVEPAVNQMRETIHASMGRWELPVAGMKSVEERRIPFRVRIYTPEGTAPYGALIYFHGGGWVLCNLDTHDGVCRDLARRSGCIVISVDYRLSPEHKFPAAVEDALAAVRWVLAQADELKIDASRVGVGGDSAGGNLAAVAAQAMRGQLAFQLLIYPVTDYGFATASYREFQDGYFLTRQKMENFYKMYLREEAEGADMRVSPLRAGNIEGLPRALVILAEYDPLRDEGMAYAKKMEAAGVEVKTVVFEGMIHPFFNMSAIFPQTLEARQMAGTHMREALGIK